MKALVKDALRSFGFEVHRIRRNSKQDSEPPKDEVIPGPWISNVLDMANRHYQPKHLRYHRTVYGDDQRLKYIAYFLDVCDQRVLEIGPLEGQHSVLLEKMGARENIAIEAREDNLRKCNRVKEKYGLARTTFLQHDLERLCDGTERPQFEGAFDIVFCLGVLYHLRSPGRALQWFRSRTDTVFLGTHYVDDPGRPAQKYPFNGKTYRAVLQSERGHFDADGRWRQDGSGELGALSGTADISALLFEDDLIALIRDCGFSRVHVLGKDLQNQAAHITILAQG
jgi:hypothetical protein